MSEPIAIIGMACRFAGGVDTPEKLWTFCAEGRSGWSEIPASRFNVESVYHPNAQKINATNVRGGYFLNEDPAFFDANFFSLSSEIASIIDPQFRLQLESAYEAFESAGLTLQDIAGSNTSVFAGSFFRDYAEGNIRDPEVLSRYYLLGIGSALAANRISHFYDLKGPSITMDTGCSTTLTALHQACQSLRTKECDMALVGGANIILNPDMFIAMSSVRSSLLSPDGKSFAFDSRANGYARGEGSATLLIKRLDKALQDGDPIRAIIRETAANQDGKTETLTTPSGQAQEKMVRECYRKAGLDPAETAYFEAHGTGTPTGDPIEAKSIGSVFKASRVNNQYIRVGSVKTNIGHTENTSGLASIIKVALALEHGQIPPSINFENPNPKIDFDGWKLKVPTELEAWPEVGVGGIRRASVNNFGYGGANAHAIMEDYSSSSRPSTNGLTNGHTNGITNGNNPKHHSNRPRVFVLSAKDEQATEKMAENLKAYLAASLKAKDNEAEFLDNLAYTLSERRTRFPWVATTSAQCLSDLNTVLGSGKMKIARVSDRKPRLGFVFTGQGAQWWAMGRELIDAYPTFKDSLLESQSILEGFGCPWSLMDELTKSAETSQVGEQHLGMPICVVLQIALVELLSSWGINPSAVTSHSSGEIASAFAAGALSKKSAIGIGYARGQLVPKSKGGMIAVGLGLEDCSKYISRVSSGKLVAGCINSPTSTTVSGDASGVDEIEQLLKADGVFARKLRVTTAYHSHHISPFSEAYQSWIRKEVDPQRPVRFNTNDDALDAIFSSPTYGQRITSAKDLCDPFHWAKSLCDPVQFVDAFKRMCLAEEDSSLEVDFIIEIGPHSALGGPVQEIMSLSEFQGHKLPYATCLVRNTNAISTTHSLVCDLLRGGYPVDMEAVNFPLGKHSVKVITDLPHYPWNHQIRHWCEPRNSRAFRNRSQVPHDLLGSPDPGTNPNSPTWRNLIRDSDLPWVRDHTVQSNMVYPGAGFICMAIEAAAQSWNTGGKTISGYRFRDVDILQALVIPEGPTGVEARLELLPCSDKAIYAKGWKEFLIHSVSNDNKWTEVCRGLVTVEFADQQAMWSNDQLDQPMDLEAYRVRVFPQDIYSNMRSVGIYHGPIFQNLKSIQARTDQSVSILTVPDTAAVMPYVYQQAHVIHPTTLDTVVQSAYPALPESRSGGMQQALIPRSIKSMWVSHDISKSPGHVFRSYAAVTHKAKQSIQTQLTVFDEQSNLPVIRFEGLTLQSLGNTITQSPERLYESEKISVAKWVPDLTYTLSAYLKNTLKCAVPDGEAETVLDLRRVCFYFIQDALNTTTDAEVAKLEPHFQKHYNWMKMQSELAQSNKLAPDSSEWVKDPVKTRRRLMAKAKAASINGEVVCRLGPSIFSIMKREKTLEQLIQGDSLLSRYYADAIKLNRSRRQINTLVKHFVHKLPRAKILEIGAGTGILTKSNLNVIGTDDCGWGPLAATYDFTDVSSTSFETAQEKFRPWKNLVRYKKLDIEQDISKQGFEPGSYDLVVASQTLHATKNMKHTMANARQLLKPGGKLFVMESTQDPVDLPFIFGLFPDWWIGEEEERQLSPSLSITAWDRVLRESSFSGVELEVHDCEDEELRAFSVMVSTALDDKEPSKPPTSAVVLITNDTKANTPPPSWIEAFCVEIARITGMRPAVTTLETANPNGKLCIYLGDLAGTPVLKAPTCSQFEAIRRLCITSKGLLWVTKGGSIGCENVDSSMVAGLLRSVREEFGGKRLITLDLDPSSTDTWSTSSIPHLIEVFKNTLGSRAEDDQDFEFAERDDAIQVLRYLKDVEKNQAAFGGEVSNTQLSPAQEPFCQQGRVLRMYIGTAGLLDTITYRDDADFVQDDSALDPDYMEVEPRAFGLNFRDVMVAMGQLGTRTAMGFECAGVVKRVGANAAAQGGFKSGDRIATVMVGNYASLVRIPYTSAAPIPDDLDFETAASMPMIFVTAYIALFDTARLQKGERILIHAATGGVGQAAIILAKHCGAEIFATVSTPEKRALLVDKYGIAPDHIFSSRDTSFGDGVRLITQGQGVDVVLNSLSGPLLQEGFNSLRRFGRFVEIGKRDLEINSSLELATFDRCVSFFHIDTSQLIVYNGAIIHRTMKEIMRLFSEGHIRPVTPLAVYPLSDLEKTFRLMQAGKHIGKIVISVSPDELVSVQPQRPLAKLRPDASYLVVGGLGGVGLSVCQWMAEHGAKNIIVISRSANKDGKVALLEREMAAFGAKVKAASCDITDEGELIKALWCCQKDMPPVRGVIQSAMVLRDSIFEQMTFENYQAATRPKVQGSLNLHRVFDGVDLDFFIMLSSLVGVMGNLGQANYSAGSSFQDALAMFRNTRGLAGASIDIGAIRSVGYVSEHHETAQFLRDQGHRLLSEEDVLNAIEYAVVSPRCGQVMLGLNTGPGVHWGKTCMGRDLRFAPLRFRESVAQTATPSSGTGDIGTKIAQATSLEDAGSVVVQAIRKKLMDIFMMSEKEVDVAKGLSDHGVDSLVAVELRNLLTVRASAEVSVFDILQSASINSLGLLVASKSSHINASLVSV